MRYLSEHQRRLRQAVMDITPEEAKTTLDEFAADAVSTICEGLPKALSHNLELMKEYLHESAETMNLSNDYAEGVYQKAVKKIEKHFAYNDDFVVGEE